MRIEWGQSLGDEIGARLGITPQSGLVLDLGVRSAQLLVSQKLSGFLPARAAHPLLNNGSLKPVVDAPSFDFPAYVCWRSDLEPEMVAEVTQHIKTALAQ